MSVGGTTARAALLLRPADHQGAGLEAGDPAGTSSPAASAGASAVLGLGARLAGNERLARERASASAPRPTSRQPAAADRRPRPARALPQHAPRVQGHLADERRQLDPRRSQRRRVATRPRGSSCSGCLPRVKRLARARRPRCSAPPLATYTARARRGHGGPRLARGAARAAVRLRPSAAASAGAAAAIAASRRGDAGPARRLAVGAAPSPSVVDAGDGAAARRCSASRTAQGEAGTLREAREGGSLGGAALLALAGRRSRGGGVAGGALCSRARRALRWSVFKAGFQSARDPKYTVVPQRERAQASSSPS